MHLSPGFIVPMRSPGLPHSPILTCFRVRGESRSHKRGGQAGALARILWRVASDDSILHARGWLSQDNCVGTCPSHTLEGLANEIFEDCPGGSGSDSYDLGGVIDDRKRP